MFEGDKEKYKKFLKNLENALAEADIQKRIREIVRDTKGLAAIDAVEADKQNEHDFEKNKKIIIFHLTKGGYGDIFVYRRC